MVLATKSGEGGSQGGVMVEKTLHRSVKMSKFTLLAQNIHMKQMTFKQADLIFKPFTFRGDLRSVFSQVCCHQVFWAEAQVSYE